MEQGSCALLYSGMYTQRTSGDEKKYIHSSSSIRTAAVLSGPQLSEISSSVVLYLEARHVPMEVGREREGEFVSQVLSL